MRGGGAVDCGTVAGVDPLQRWNELPPDEAEAELMSCCAAPAWARAVAAGRPYEDLSALLDAAAEVLGALTWPEVEVALRAHPRIGARVGGADRESRWSRREQSAARSGDAAAQRRLAELNRAYEERFDRVFLIFASGKSADEIVAAAAERLGHDEATEREVIRAELGKIAHLRLERLFG